MYAKYHTENNRCVSSYKPRVNYENQAKATHGMV